MSLAVDDPLAAGRYAFDRHAWGEAFEILSDADRTESLSGEGLRMLAHAAWWSGRPDDVLSAGERAYRTFLEEENRSAAIVIALDLARTYAARGTGHIAGGWLANAERLAADEPETSAHSYLSWMKGFVTLITNGDIDTAVSHLDRALEIAKRTGDRDTQVMSLHDKGRVLCGQGRMTEGLALIDEATAAVVGGDLDPFATGYVYCGTISVSSQRGDYRRASEWNDATTRWCERFSIGGFPGICRVHRAEITRLRGGWSAAEAEARLACDELPKFNLMFAMYYAFYEIGEVRRLMGDFKGAEEAYGRAHDFGQEPQPGLSLVYLAIGKPEAAAAGVHRALADETNRLARIKLLAAQSMIAIDSGSLDTAVAASEELDAIAAEVGTTALTAEASEVRGAVSLARSDFEGAVKELRLALRGWQEVELPYEVARVRVLLAKAYHALGDREGALLELRSAREGFERLGAAWDLETSAELLGELTGSAYERVKRAFVFTDIVKSTDLVRAIGDEAWEDLLRWHDQTLRSVFASHGGEVAHHTGDGFFVTFARAEQAIAGAVAVQRVLAEHRRQTGFAPVVRIGVHSAEATRHGQDYSGSEVHKAARIAAEAEGWEILASEDTVQEAAGDVKITHTRDVELKGIDQPVRVGTIEWRTA